MSVHRVIREGRKRLGLSEQKFAELVGVTRGSVQQWEKEGGTAPNRSKQAMVAKALGISVAHLMSGLSNVDAAETAGDVPLISWVQAGDWADAVDTFHPGEAEEWLPCVRKHSKSSFALRVRGDSMTAPHGNSRTYPEDCIIFVDPEKRMPMNGDRVIAKLSGSNEVTFKVYKHEDGRQWLMPLNPSHEPIRESFKVLGTIIGKWEDD